MIAPEGKILPGLIRQRLKKTLQVAMSEVTQFGFVAGRGTEEAICKAPTHIDEAIASSQTFQRIAGKGLGVTVNSVRLRGPRGSFSCRG